MEILGNNNTGEKKTFRSNEPDRESEQTEISRLELTLIKTLLISPTFVEELLDKQEIMESPEARKVLNIMFELYGLKEDFDSGEIMDFLEPEESQKLTRELDKIIIAGNEDKVFAECIQKWKADKLLAREKQLIDRLSLADEDSGVESIKELTEELMEVQAKIKTYGGRI